MPKKQVLPVADPEAVGIDPERLKAVGETMQRYIDTAKVPNMITAIARRGKLVHFEARGVQDLTTAKPADKDMIVRLYSNSKAIAGVATMILCEDGLLHLDDPVSKFLPAFKDPWVVTPSARQKTNGPEILPPLVRAKREITVRDCLCNTTGLATPIRTFWAVGKYYEDLVEESGWDLAEDLDRPPRNSYRERVDNHARIPLIFEPGTDYEYHVGYPVIGVLIEAITGVTLEEFYRERIFAPLRMNDTSFYLDEAKLDRFATCYVPVENDGSWKLTVYDTPETSQKVVGPKVHYGAGGDLGGVLSTVGDYLRFAQMLCNGGELDGEKILSRKSVRIMTSSHIGDLTPPALEPGFGFGLGVGVYKGDSPMPIMRTSGSFGWGGAAGTMFFVDPAEELAAVCFTQVLHRNLMPGNDYQEAFERVVYQTLK